MNVFFLLYCRKHRELKETADGPDPDVVTRFYAVGWVGYLY